MPILFTLQGQSHGIRNKGIPAVLMGRLPQPVSVFTISGTTKDETGAALPGATCYLMDMSDGTPRLVQTTISDGSGNYSFSVGGGINYWIVDYKVGSPDKAGATLNTLTGI